jgi:hypothetical protein
LETAQFSKDDFSQWVIDGLLSPLNTVRQLPRILDDQEAREVFLKDGAQEAIKCLEIEPADASLAEATMTQLAQELGRRVSRMEFRDMQRLKSDPESEDSQSLLEAKTQLVQCLTLMLSYLGLLWLGAPLREYLRLWPST